MNAPNPTSTSAQTQISEIKTFLDCLFGEMGKGEEIPFWASAGKSVGFPKDEAAFLKTMRRSSQKNACYFGTATMRRDEEGKLYNRGRQFAGYYVVVLDDIGTGEGSKIHPDKIPPGLAELATYRIETSPDNEQWGFALDHPIRDLEVAKAFQREIVSRSGADSGGMMPNKLVRMPCGVNLKEKYQTDGGPLFECRLVEFHPDRWPTPEQLLLAVDAGVSWDQLVKRAESGVGARRTGASAHRPKVAYHASLEGIVDPILEWLNETDQIVSERGEWVDIICPWASEHTDGGGNTAGYAPIGGGENPERRGFHCFHDSCNGHRTGDFLLYVTEEGGPRASALSPIEAHVSRWAFDMESNRAIDMKSESLSACPQTGFKNQLASTIFVPDGKGRMMPVSEYALYINDPNRLKLAGCDHLPGGARMIKSKNGGLPRLNLWRLPEWGDGEFDLDKVQPFIDFIRYLIPNRADSDWFLDHIAAKAQDPHYRGAGVILSTPAEGSGRGTLSRVLGQMWGNHNLASITLSELISGASSSDNNSWAVRDWIVVPEAKETGMSAKVAFTAYESLKKFIEPAGTVIQVKEKWAITQHVECFGSVIICSQHSDVIPTDSGGTRFKRIENTVEVWSPEQFKALYEWIESGFEPHVWRWLRARDLSKFDLRARQAPLSVVEETRKALESQRAVDSALGLCVTFAEAQTLGIVFVEEFLSYLESISDPLGLEDVKGWKRVVRRELINRTRDLVRPNGNRWRPRFGERSVKVRATIEREGLILTRSIRKSLPGTLELTRTCSEIDIDGLKERFLIFCRNAMQDAD